MDQEALTECIHRSPFSSSLKKKGQFGGGLSRLNLCRTIGIVKQTSVDMPSRFHLQRLKKIVANNVHATWGIFIDALNEPVCWRKAKWNGKYKKEILLAAAVHEYTFGELVKMYDYVPWQLNVTGVKIEQNSDGEMPFQRCSVELQPHFIFLFVLLYVSYEMFTNLANEKSFFALTYRNNFQFVWFYRILWKFNIKIVVV